MELAEAVVYNRGISFSIRCTGGLWLVLLVQLANPHALNVGGYFQPVAVPLSSPPSLSTSLTALQPIQAITFLNDQASLDVLKTIDNPAV